MGTGGKAPKGEGGREELDEMLVAAAVLCLQLGETDAADHVLEALRSLHYRAANDAQ